MIARADVDDALGGIRGDCDINCCNVSEAYKGDEKSIENNSGKTMAVCVIWENIFLNLKFILFICVLLRKKLVIIVWYIMYGNVFTFGI